MVGAPDGLGDVEVELDLLAEAGEEMDGVVDRDAQADRKDDDVAGVHFVAAQPDVPPRQHERRDVGQDSDQADPQRPEQQADDHEDDQRRAQQRRDQVADEAGHGPRVDLGVARETRPDARRGGEQLGQLCLECAEDAQHPVAPHVAHAEHDPGTPPVGGQERVVLRCRRDASQDRVVCLQSRASGIAVGGQLGAEFTPARHLRVDLLVQVHVGAGEEDRVEMGGELLGAVDAPVRVRLEEPPVGVGGEADLHGHDAAELALDEAQGLHGGVALFVGFEHPGVRDHGMGEPEEDSDQDEAQSQRHARAPGDRVPREADEPGDGVDLRGDRMRVAGGAEHRQQAAEHGDRGHVEEAHARNRVPSQGLELLAAGAEQCREADPRRQERQETGDRHVGDRAAGRLERVPSETLGLLGVAVDHVHAVGHADNEQQHGQDVGDDVERLAAEHERRDGPGQADAHGQQGQDRA